MSTNTWNCSSVGFRLNTVLLLLLLLVLLLLLLLLILLLILLILVILLLQCINIIIINNFIITVYYNCCCCCCCYYCDCDHHRYNFEVNFFFYTAALGVDFFFYRSCENCESNGVRETICHVRTDFAACFQSVCSFMKITEDNWCLQGKVNVAAGFIQRVKVGKMGSSKTRGAIMVLSRKFKPFSGSSIVTQSRTCASSPLSSNIYIFLF